MTARLFAWAWVAAGLILYMWQFADLLGPLAGKLGLK